MWGEPIFGHLPMSHSQSVISNLYDEKVYFLSQTKTTSCGGVNFWILPHVT